MKKNEFRYQSCDAKTKIHGIEWVPDREPIAVLQICHGMKETIERYDEFARYMAEKGIVVIGNDHLGHGESIVDDSCLGFFEETRGNQCVISDIHRLCRWGRKRYPEKPYFMLGHSMGSFLLRQYLITYPEETITGAMILGTGSHMKVELVFGKLLCAVVAMFGGWKYRSKVVEMIAMGNMNKRFEPAETPFEWLTNDRDIIMRYAENEKNNYMFTVNGYYQMFTGMEKLCGSSGLKHMNKKLPILFAAGADDPVGNFGKAVKQVYQKYEKAGFEDVELSLYEGKRHELINEVDRDKIFEDFYFWIEEHVI